MPREIPYHDLLFHTLRYLVKRQIEQRPTTIFKLSKRVGFGIDHVLGMFESSQVEYTLVPHVAVDDLRTTEIILKKIPESIVVQLGIGNSEIEKSFTAILEIIEPLTAVEPPETAEEMVEVMDPLVKYRIQKHTFELLESELIYWKTLSRKLHRKGYPKYFIHDEFLPRKLYEQLSPLWRPFCYNKGFYFLQRALKSTQELDQFFPDISTVAGGIKKAKYRRKKTPPENPFLFRAS